MHRRTQSALVAVLTVQQLIEQLIQWGLSSEMIASILSGSVPNRPVTGETVSRWSTDDDTDFNVAYVGRLSLLLTAREVLIGHPNYPNDATALIQACNSLSGKSLLDYLHVRDERPAVEMIEMIRGRHGHIGHIDQVGA